MFQCESRRHDRASSAISIAHPSATGAQHPYLRAIVASGGHGERQPKHRPLPLFEGRSHAPPSSSELWLLALYMVPSGWVLNAMQKQRKCGFCVPDVGSMIGCRSDAQDSNVGAVVSSVPSMVSSTLCITLSQQQLAASVRGASTAAFLASSYLLGIAPGDGAQLAPDIFVAPPHASDLLCVGRSAGMVGRFKRQAGIPGSGWGDGRWWKVAVCRSNADGCFWVKDCGFGARGRNCSNREGTLCQQMAKLGNLPSESNRHPFHRISLLQLPCACTKCTCGEHLSGSSHPLLDTVSCCPFPREAVASRRCVASPPSAAPLAGACDDQHLACVTARLRLGKHELQAHTEVRPRSCRARLPAQAVGSRRWAGDLCVAVVTDALAMDLAERDVLSPYRDTSDAFLHPTMALGAAPDRRMGATRPPWGTIRARLVVLGTDLPGPLAGMVPAAWRAAGAAYHITQGTPTCADLRHPPRSDEPDFPERGVVESPPKQTPGADQSWKRYGPLQIPRQSVHMLCSVGAPWWMASSICGALSGEAVCLGGRAVAPHASMLFSGYMPLAFIPR